eukprot:1371614-Pyramimonas_sp.AAC.1
MSSPAASRPAALEICRVPEADQRPENRQAPPGPLMSTHRGFRIPGEERLGGEPATSLNSDRREKPTPPRTGQHRGIPALPTAKLGT